MKTLLMLALVGLSVNGYAQNKCNCSCKHKTTMHATAKVVHYGTAPERSDDKLLPDYVTVLPHVPNTYVAVPPAPEACHVYSQHNIVVKECPGTFYDNKGNIQFEGAGTWMGYYPSDGTLIEDMPRDIAPQHNVINNYKGVAPADGNSCNGCDPQ